jgi:hypothetical protein
VDRPRHLDALVTVDFAAGTPNLKPDLDRLLRNQADSHRDQALLRPPRGLS